MHIPNPSLLPTFFRELFVRRTLKREPEPSLVMEDEEEVQAFVTGGKSNALAAVYVFVTSHVSQVIHGRRRVLDLGCGPATLLCQIAKANPAIDFVGVDLSPTMIAEARRAIKAQGLENVSIVQDDITKLSQFPDDSFDGIISSFALHHLPTARHLNSCFGQIKRLLEPGGAVFIFDFGRLKSVQSVIQMAYLNAQEDPYLLTLDRERSMRAAFTLEDFQRLSKEYLPSDCSVYSTVKVPMFMIIQTKPKQLPIPMEDAFCRQRLAMAPKFRIMLDDIRLFFELGGLQHDLFGPTVPTALQKAKLKMLEIAEFPLIRRIHTSELRRAVGIIRLGCKIVAASVNFRLKLLLRPSRAVESRDQLMQRMAGAFRAELGALKGPLIKFGQMASYLTHDIPPAIQEALKPLQYSSPPLSGSRVRRIVEEELRQPIGAIFKEWYDAPIAAASISQLHLARLPNDKLVVVKVRYPGILRAIRSDFRMLKMLSPLLKRWWGLHNIKELIHELEELILNECDFAKAGAFQEEFRLLFHDDPQVMIPKVYTDYSTSSVLTMDHVDGLSYEEFKKTATQESKNRAGLIMWRMAALSINRHCIYNADPHQGNYFFVGDKVAFIDFGFTRRFSSQFMDLWKEQSMACCEGDFDRFTKVNQRMGYEVPGKKFNHRALFDLYRGLIFDSWAYDREFLFTKDFVDQELKGLLGLYQNSHDGLRMPVEFVSILRLLWGQHSLLADLGAKANWHAAVYPLLKEPSAADQSVASTRGAALMCL